MLKKEDLDKIESEVKEFFKKMTFEVGAIEISSQEEGVFLSLRVKEPQALIGEEGKNLKCLQWILKLILKRKISEEFRLSIDINDYRKKKEEYLKELAQKLADEVVFEKKEKALPAMSAYERRIIHLELADRKDVITQSVGEEPERKVIIKPYP